MLNYYKGLTVSRHYCVHTSQPRLLEDYYKTTRRLLEDYKKTTRRLQEDYKKTTRRLLEDY